MKSRQHRTGSGETPIETSLRGGHIIGYVPRGYSIIVDPDDHVDDVMAIEYANDELIANMLSGVLYGYLYIPSTHPDGNEFTIDLTITIGDNTNSTTVFLRGWDFGGEYGNLLNVIINDG